MEDKNYVTDLLVWQDAFDKQDEILTSPELKELLTPGQVIEGDSFKMGVHICGVDCIPERGNCNGYCIGKEKSPNPLAIPTSSSKLMNCLAYALRFWEKEPSYKLYYDSGHVINSWAIPSSKNWLPVEEYGYEYFKASFDGLLDEHETKLLNKYFHK